MKTSSKPPSLWNWSWQLVVEGYDPETAQMVIDTISEIKDERVFTVMLNLVCDEAREKMNWN